MDASDPESGRPVPRVVAGVVMCDRYLGSALGGALTAVWDEDEAFELWASTEAELRDGHPATAFTVWIWSEMREVRLAPLRFRRLDPQSE